MTRHKIKSWPEYFEPIFSGEKEFELRKDDRHYKVGDILVIQEWDDRAGKYTGREVEKKITYKLEGLGSPGTGVIAPLHGLSRGYCILSIAPA